MVSPELRQRQSQKLSMVSPELRPTTETLPNWLRSGQQAYQDQGHRIKIGGLGRMANPAFGENLGFCGTSSHLVTMFVVALVIVNKYNIYVHYLVTIENLRKLRKK